MDISLLLPCHIGTSTPNGKSVEMPSIPSTLSLQKHHIYPIPHAHIFFINSIMSKVLSVLISINVQAKSDINLSGQGMVITNQGVAIQPCFYARKTYAIY